MPEVLTESFCERCGTRYEFEAPARLNTLRKTRGLVSGLKNYIMSQDSLEDAVGDAMRSEEEAIASNQLAAFHEAFNFCINCRQYACTNCWNDAAGRCRTCAPIPGVDDLEERMEAAYLADHSAMHGGAVADRELAADEISRRLGAEAWPQTDLTEAPATNGHAPVDWPMEPGLAQVEPPEEPEAEPVLAEAAVAEGIVAEPAPAPEVAPVLDWEADAEALVASLLAQPEVQAESELAPLAEALEADAEPAMAVEVEAEEPDAAAAPMAPELEQPQLAAAEISDEPAPTAEWLVEEPVALEPEPEPIYAEAESEPVVAELEPDPAMTAALEPDAVAAEIEPEPVVAEAEPAPEPLPAAAEAEPEPILAEEIQPESVVAADAGEPEIEAPGEPQAELPPPTPIGPRRIVPLSETVIPVPQPARLNPLATEPPPMDEAALAARKAQLELLGIEDPGVGTVAPVRPNRLAYRSRGAATHPSELVHRTLGTSALWDASAREVAAARSVVAVQNCGGCGLSLSASARFCRRCGTRQARSA